MGWRSKMRTQYVATIALDEARLAKDIEQTASFRFSEAYSNYLIGGPWKSVMLWAPDGDTGSGVMTTYANEQRSAFTEYGRRLPYLQELITNTVDLSRLHFVRMAVFTDSVIIPHRDYLELTDVPDEVRWEHRMHIPLVTHENCWFSQDNVVYRMRAGEIWHFDAAQIHAAVSLSTSPRIHLVFDFVNRTGSGSLVNAEPDGTGEDIPAQRRIDRPRLTDVGRAGLMRLADVLTMDNVREVFSIVIKSHFRWDGGENTAWDTMTDIARASPDPAVLPHVLELRRYFTLDRTVG